MRLVPTSAAAAIILAAIAFVTLWQSGVLIDDNGSSPAAQGGRHVGDHLRRGLGGLFDVATPPGKDADGGLGRGPPDDEVEGIDDEEEEPWPTDEDGHEYDPNSLIVRFTSPDLPEAAKAAARAAVGANAKGKGLSKSLGLELMTFPKKKNGNGNNRNSGNDMKEKIAALKKNRNVRYAELDYRVHTVQNVPNDPRFSELWGMQDGPGGSNAEGAWAKGFVGSRDVVVGVIDSGIDYNHDDLAANIWTNPGEIPGNGLDDDNNGYTDDVNGWDFFSNDNNPFDGQDDYHGTHCAGTIGAVGNNGIGVVGINWNVQIISAKFLGPQGGSTSGAIAAVNYMVDLKRNRGVNIRVLSNSWGGGGFSSALRDAIDDAGDNDILFVAAAGNNSRNTDSVTYYPSNYQCTNGGSRSWDCVVSVASVTSSGALSSFSNYGASTVDIAAPGSSILSTYPFNSYGSIGGTSMSTPHVSGAIALCAAANPAQTAEEIRLKLMQSVTPTLSGLVASGGTLDVSALADLCAIPCTQNSDCNDNNQCTTDTCVANSCNSFQEPECCGDGICTTSEADGTPGNYCLEDCCGDGICSAPEAAGGANSCTQDCCYSPGDCPAVSNSCYTATCTANVCGIDQSLNCCGNGICEGSASENDSSCVSDCGMRELETTFAGGRSQSGNFFELDAINDLYMRGVEINTGSGQAQVEVYYYHGSYSGVMSNSGAWELLVSTTVTSSGTGSGTPVNFPDLKLLTSAAGSQVHSFYVTRTDGGSLTYTLGSGEGDMYTEDANIMFKEGRGVAYPFGTTWVPRVLNGVLMYQMGIDDPGTTSPTTSPSKKPTSSPVTPSPTKAPVTANPTSSPSKKPTASPSKFPTASPETPTSSPTKSPVTPSPTSAPSKSPETPSPTSSPMTPSPTSSPAKSPVTPSPTSAPSKSPETPSPTTGMPTQAPNTPMPTAAATPNPTPAPVSAPSPWWCAFVNWC